MRSLNVKLLAATLVALALLGVGVHFLHAYQVRRNAAGLKEQAEREREQGNLDKAANYLDRYLRLEPHDTEALVEYAELRDDTARTPRDFFAVLDLFEKVLRAESDQDTIRRKQDKIRRKAVTRLMQVNRWNDALDHLKKLIKPECNDDELGELYSLQGQCEEGQGKHSDAVKSLQVSVTRDPTRLDAYALCAAIQRAHPDPNDDDGANKTLEEMVAKNEMNPIAYVLRIRHYRAFLAANLDKRDEWEQRIADDVKAALAKDDNAGNAEVLIEAVAFYQEKETREKAQKNRDPVKVRLYAENQRSYLEMGTEKHPADFRFRQQLAYLELAAGNKDKAIEQLRHFIAEHPRDAGGLLARVQLGVILVDSQLLKDAEDERDQLRSVPGLALWADFLDARIKVAKGEWWEAARQVESIRAQLASWPDQDRAANFLLAQCYERLDEQDLRLDAARRMVSLAPMRIDGHAALASALAANGRIEEALQESQLVARNLPAFDLKVAQLLLVKLQRLPKSARTKEQWNAVEERLQTAEKAEPESIMVALTRASAFAAQGDFAKAQQVLEKAKTNHDERVEIRIALANLADVQNEHKQALDVLDQARKDLGDGAELRIGQARHWAAIHKLATRKLEENKFAAAGTPPESEAEKKAAETETRRLESEKREAEDRLRELEHDLDELSGGDPCQLLAVLAETYTRMGNAKDAERLWNEVRRKRPADLNCRLALFDLTLQEYEAERIRQALKRGTEKTPEASDGEKNALKTLKNLVEEIQGIESDDGTRWRYCKAAVLFTGLTRTHESEGRKKADAQLAEVLLAEAAKRRPAWPPIPRLQAKLADMQGNAERAIELFQRALDLGDRHPDTKNRLVALLWKKGRFPDADLAMRKAAKNAPLSVELGKLATAAAWLNMNVDGSHALDVAEQVAAGSDDYREHLWLAQQIITLAGTKDKADSALNNECEKALNKAAELANEKNQFAPEILVAKVRFFSATKQTSKADAALQEAERTLPSKAPFALAACYDVMGQREKADDVCERAIRAKPDDVATLRTAASFCVSRNQTKRAEQLLGIMLGADSKSTDSDKAWARRTLALVLVAYGDFPAFKKALDLLDQNIEANGDSAEDRLVKAKVLSTQPDRLRESIELFEQIETQAPLSIEDQFMLARLYEVNKDWIRACTRMHQLLDAVEEGPSAPGYISAFINGLIKHEELVEADEWQTKLEKLQPRALTTLEMRIRLLKAQGRPEEDATALIEERSKASDAPLQGLAAIAEALGNKELAEKLYRKMASPPKKPEDVLQLAMFLGRSDPSISPKDALDICFKARKTCTPDSVALVSVALLRSTEATDEQRAEVEVWLNATIKGEKTPNVALLANLAELQDQRGKFNDSEATWRLVLARNPDHIIALNNLACLLAYRHANDPEASNALQLIDRAISLTERIPEFLDSRAIVLLNLGKVTEAIQDLESAISRKPSASKYYHLALAYQKARKPEDAKAALKKARDLKLTEKDLHPLELLEYKEVLASIDLN